jgi:hypothetical protein
MNWFPCRTISMLTEMPTVAEMNRPNIAGQRMQNSTKTIAMLNSRFLPERAQVSNLAQFTNEIELPSFPWTNSWRNLTKIALHLPSIQRPKHRYTESRNQQIKLEETKWIFRHWFNSTRISGSEGCVHELPAHDLMVWILRSSTTTLTRWVMSPANRNRFISASLRSEWEWSGSGFLGLSDLGGGSSLFRRRCACCGRVA